MEGFGATTYGDAFADVYDEWYREVSPVEASVRFVQQRCAGTVLELGSGTGRLAGPLRAAGTDVIGVDVSTAMLTRSRASHPAVPVVAADMRELAMRPGCAGGVLVAFNTLFNLPDRTAQRRAMVAIADALAPGGVAVIETFVPGSGAEQAVDAVDLIRLDADVVVLRVSRTDPAARTVSGHHVELRDGAPVRLRPWHVCFGSPADVDDLAAAAGLVCLDRFGGWDGDAFTETSDVHVAVYGKRTDGR